MSSVMLAGGFFMVFMEGNPGGGDGGRALSGGGSLCGGPSTFSTISSQYLTVLLLFSESSEPSISFSGLTKLLESELELAPSVECFGLM